MMPPSGSDDVDKDCRIVRPIIATFGSSAKVQTTPAPRRRSARLSGEVDQVLKDGVDAIAPAEAAALDGKSAAHWRSLTAPRISPRHRARYLANRGLSGSIASV